MAALLHRRQPTRCAEVNIGVRQIVQPAPAAPMPFRPAAYRPSAWSIQFSVSRQSVMRIGVP